MGRDTVWVLGDQLNRSIGALAAADPSTHRILLIEAEDLLRRGQHVQRLHLVIAAMRRFARELEEEGFEVDLVRAADLATGLTEHRARHQGTRVVATEPNSRAAQALCRRLDIDTVRSNQFLCHPDEFAAWAGDDRSLTMERFYRWNRARHGYLMDGTAPTGGTWNLDHENREPPPRDPSVFTQPPSFPLDDLDRDLLASLPESPGAPPGASGWWATDRAGALAALDHFCQHSLPDFGRYEDAMTSGSWHLAHSLLSPYLNLGLLLPGEVCEAVEVRYRGGQVPLNSAEGFIRQVVGWREYVWGIYWLWPEHRRSNALDHHEPLPPAMTGSARTHMRCLASVVDGLDQRAWVHHIERLMVLSNLSNLVGVEPRAVLDWMSSVYIDAADWVMVPNVMGMALWADGGRMATKPYVSGGAYLKRMSDHCKGCRYDHRRRTGDDACPFTTLYWDFIARHADVLAGNHRMARAVASMRSLSDLGEVRETAVRIRRGLAEGSI